MGKSTKRKLEEVDLNSYAPPGASDVRANTKRARLAAQPAAAAKALAPKAKAKAKTPTSTAANMPASTKATKGERKAEGSKKGKEKLSDPAVQKRLMATMPKKWCGEEKWKELGFQVRLQEDASARGEKQALQREYWNCFQKALVLEAQRVEGTKQVSDVSSELQDSTEVDGAEDSAEDNMEDSTEDNTEGSTKKKTKPSQRPDRVAQTLLREHLKQIRLQAQQLEQPEAAVGQQAGSKRAVGSKAAKAGGRKAAAGKAGQQAVQAAGGKGGKGTGAAAGEGEVGAAGSGKAKKKGAKEDTPDKVLGFVPGIMANDQFFNRAEMSVVGMHGPPLAGIDYMTQNEVAAMTGKKYCKPVAVSIVVAGNYEDNNDKGETIIYTGQGGNDLLGRKKQKADQKFEAGNLALAGNVETGVPVRVTRKNMDSQSVYGVVYTFDGLYRVEKWWTEPGKEGFQVFKYRLTRLPNQQPLLSKTVTFGGVKQVPLQIIPQTRPKVLHLDLSMGRERVPVVVVNEVDRELPPGIDPHDPKQAEYLVAPSSGSRGQAKAGAKANPSDFVKSSVGYSFRYITECEFDARVTRPKAGELVKGAARLGDEERRQKLHAKLAVLNGGGVAYHLAGKTEGVVSLEAPKKGRLAACARFVRLRKMPMALSFECGTWCGCPDGNACIQAPTALGLRLRLEVFKTKERGWGVRCWDTIPAGAPVCPFIGRIYRLEDAKELPAEYQFDMEPRTDMATGVHEAQYVVDPREVGNVARFINHSCDPNLYVQPVCSGHTDPAFCTVTFVAWRNIPPLTELSYDYGEAYVQQQLGGKCLCGASCCVSKPKQPEISDA